MKRRIAEVFAGIACVCLLADTGYAQVTLAAHSRQSDRRTGRGPAWRHRHRTAHRHQHRQGGA